MLRRLHPTLDPRRSVAECVHGTEDLESGLLGAAMAKVLGHGDSDVVTCPREHRRCAHQTISATRRIRNARPCLRFALEVNEAVEMGPKVRDAHLNLRGPIVSV